MDQPLEIALVGLGVASLSSLVPLATLIITYKLNRASKIEDYARQDLVAERVDRAAKQAAVAAALLAKSTTIMIEQGNVTNNKLSEIHTLVNSNLTSEMQSRLVALEGQIALTKELGRAQPPSNDATVALANLEETAAGLRTSLSERLAVTAPSHTR